MRNRVHLTALLFLVALLYHRQGRALASVDILYFRARPTTQLIALEWATGFELDNLGFNVLRSTASSRETAEIINAGLIGSTNDLNGGEYEYTDTAVEPGTDYYYWLEDIDTNGQQNYAGPIHAALVSGIVLNTPAPGDDTPASTPAATLLPTEAPSGTLAATESPANTPPPSPTNSPQSAPTATNTRPATQVPAPAPTTAPTARPAATATSQSRAAPAPTTIPTQPAAEEPAESGDPFELPAVEAADDEPGATPLLPMQSIGAGIEIGASDNNALPAPATLPQTPARRSANSLALIVLLAGAGVSAAGGAATWLLIRRHQRRSAS